MVVMEFKGTKGKWVIHRETMIVTEEEQIVDVICLIPQSKESQVNWINNALLISKAPEMLQELQETLKDLLCIQGSIYNSSRIDARWEGAYDVIQKQIDRKKELIKQATEL